MMGLQTLEGFGEKILKHNNILIPRLCLWQIHDIHSPTISNGLLTGIGHKGGRFTRPELFTMAHWGHAAQWVITSQYIPGHHQWRTRAWYSFGPEKCPAIGLLRLSSITCCLKWVRTTQCSFSPRLESKKYNMPSTRVKDSA